MNKIDFDNISQQIETASKEKSNNIQNVNTAIADNNLNEKFIEIESNRELIKSIDDLNGYHSTLKSFFRSVYEVITAPGVQRFIDWLLGLDNKGIFDGNKRNKITKILIENYTEYDSKIKSILDSKDTISINNSIFPEIIKSTKVNIVKSLTALNPSSEEIHQELSQFIEDLDQLLNELSDLKELTYTNVKDFYTLNTSLNGENQNTSIIDEETDYYYDLIRVIVEKKDTLTTDQGKINLNTIAENISINIKEIYSSILHLKTLEVKEKNDNTINNLYNKFEKSVTFNSSSSISDQLRDYIDNTWNKIIDAYNEYLDFLSTKPKERIEILKKRKNDWQRFPFAGEIDQYIITINNILEIDPISEIGKNEIGKIRSAFSKSENSLATLKSENPKGSIVDFFNNSITDFRDKKIVILSKLNIDQENITTINKSIDEIERFNESIANSDSNLLETLNEDFLDGILGSYKHINDEFTKAIENTEIKNDLIYLNSINQEGTILSKEDLKNETDRLTRLLEYDLININLTKNI